MANKKKILTAEDNQLIAELSMTYDIEPEEIIFYEGDPKPFLSYEANCVVANALLNLASIGVEPVSTTFADSIAVKCTILTGDGRERSAVGVTNRSEKVDEKVISEQQAFNLASSRALRNVLKASGYDLIKMHHRAMKGEDYLNFQPNAAKDSFTSQAHALGAEAGLIIGSDKSGWYRLLNNRYGVESSTKLNETQRADFIAILRTLVPQQLPEFTGGSEEKLAA